MISVIVCSVNSALLNELKTNISNTIGTEYEVVAINNKDNIYSIAAAYNHGASQAKYPYLCFAHEDIMFHTNNWGNNLIGHLSGLEVALIGVLGNTIKTLTPSGAYIFHNKSVRINHLQRLPNGNTEAYYKNPSSETTSEVKVLDGMFLATTKANFIKYSFDENLLKGFHGYDIDFSIGQSINGKLLVIYDVLLEHFSFGNFNSAWIDAQEKVSQKWKNELPTYTSGTSKSEIKIAEIANLKQLLILMFVYNYNKQLQFLYFLRLIALAPLGLSNLYFLRKLLIYGKFESFLKLIKSKVIYS